MKRVCTLDFVIASGARNLLRPAPSKERFLAALGMTRCAQDDKMRSEWQMLRRSSVQLHFSVQALFLSSALSSAGIHVPRL